MWDLLVFALIGLLVGTAARMFYPGREPMHILGTLVLGMAGALVSGMISWGYWPSEDGQFQTGNLVLPSLGALIAIVAWASWGYGRSLRAYSNPRR